MSFQASLMSETVTLDYVELTTRMNEDNMADDCGNNGLLFGFNDLGTLDIENPFLELETYVPQVPQEQIESIPVEDGSGSAVKLEVENEDKDPFSDSSISPLSSSVKTAKKCITNEMILSDLVTASPGTEASACAPSEKSHVHLNAKMEPVLEAQEEFLFDFNFPDESEPSASAENLKIENAAQLLFCSDKSTTESAGNDHIFHTISDNILNFNGSLVLSEGVEAPTQPQNPGAAANANFVMEDSLDIQDLLHELNLPEQSSCVVRKFNDLEDVNPLLFQASSPSEEVGTGTDPFHGSGMSLSDNISSITVVDGIVASNCPINKSTLDRFEIASGSDSGVHDMFHNSLDNMLRRSPDPECTMEISSENVINLLPYFNTDNYCLSLKSSNNNKNLPGKKQRGRRSKQLRTTVSTSDQCIGKKVKKVQPRKRPSTGENSRKRKSVVRKPKTDKKPQDTEENAKPSSRGNGKRSRPVSMFRMQVAPQLRAISSILNVAEAKHISNHVPSEILRRFHPTDLCRTLLKAVTKKTEDRTNGSSSSLFFNIQTSKLHNWNQWNQEPHNYVDDPDSYSYSCSSKYVYYQSRKESEGLFSIAKSLEVNGKPTYSPEIISSIGSVELNVTLDLAKLTENKEISNVEFSKGNEYLLIRIRDPMCCGLLFQSGKLIVLGAKSYEQFRVGSRKLARMVQKAGNNVQLSKMAFHSLVGLSKLPFNVDVKGMASHELMTGFTIYEFGMFDGIVISVIETSVLCIIFSTGAVLMTNTTNRADMQTTLDLIYPCIRYFGCS